MPPPIDPALLALQTYALRKTPQASSRARPAGADGDARGTQAQPQRRQAPSVSVSLSAEALAFLNGEATRQADQAKDQRPQVASDDGPEAARKAAPAFETDGLFEPIENAPPPRRREAPFAHLKHTSPQRTVPPGTRLDITV